jgi:hypothetical protein
MSIIRVPHKYLRSDTDLSIPERALSKPRQVRVIKHGELPNTELAIAAPRRRPTKDSVANFLFNGTTAKRWRAQREANSLRQLAVLTGR